MSNELLTIAEISKRLDIPESTVRYYRDRFPDYIPSVGEGRSKRYRPEALSVIQTIAEGLRNNLTAMQVEEQLNRMFPRNIETEEEQQQSTAVAQQQLITPYQTTGFILALLSSQNKLLQQISENMDKTAGHEKEIEFLHNEIDILKEELKAAQDKREQDLLERDRELLEKVKNILEENKKQPWWRRLFG